jgi:hypothetical protein
MKFLQVFLIVVFTFSLTSKAVVDNNSTTSDKKYIQTELDNVTKIFEQNKYAKQMLDAYQKVQSYRAVWKAKSNGEFIVEMKTTILFDRKTNNVVYCAVSKNKLENSTEQEKLYILVVKKANKLSVYWNFGMAEKPILCEETKGEPNEITYRDIRKAIFLFYPADLPMMMSYMPLHEILQGNPGSFTTENADANNISLKLSGSNVGALIQIDAHTNLIKKYNHFDMDSGKNRPPVFELVNLEIDKPIKEKSFDFDEYLDKYNVKRNECTCPSVLQ